MGTGRKDSDFVLLDSDVLREIQQQKEFETSKMKEYPIVKRSGELANSGRTVPDVDLVSYLPITWVGVL